MADYKIITSDFVNLQISTSNQDLSFNERRFPKDITITNLKAKLELITGGSCSTMRLETYDKQNQFVCSLSDNNALLGSYPLENGMRLHVVDNFSIKQSIEFEHVEKYEMAPEIYAKRTDTVKGFLIKNKIGQYNEEYTKKKEKAELEEKELLNSIQIGSRCKVSISSAPTKLGTVTYKGVVEGLAGNWIGVKYDEPLGKNDGTYKGKKYFNCEPNYGAFVKPESVISGDFPEETYDLDEEI